MSGEWLTLCNGYHPLDPQLVDLKTLSRMVSTCPRTIRSWVHDATNPLPAYRVGGKLLFRRDEVERWIQQFRVEPQDVSALADEIVRMVNKNDHI